jgi:SpoVK/Ycf46/Vps4 family AAA+-type ATPase
MRDVVDRGGVVVKFTHPSLFTEGMRVFREIEPQTPIVVLMEDIDSTLQHYNESEVLNILDGVNQIEKAVFLATTNYPEELGERIINRPSRFDKRFKIDHPNPESRRMYFEYLIGPDRIAELNIPLDQWVQDTEDFSLAHLKELFVAVVILGDEYQDAIETLSSMREERLDSSKDEFKPSMGFGNGKAKKRRGFKD